MYPKKINNNRSQNISFDSSTHEDIFPLTSKNDNLIQYKAPLANVISGVSSSTEPKPPKKTISLSKKSKGKQTETAIKYVNIIHTYELFCVSYILNSGIFQRIMLVNMLLEGKPQFILKRTSD